MRKLQVFLVFIFLSLAFGSFSQLKPNTIIRGRVLLSTRGLEYASVMLLSAKDSSVIKVAVTDKEGLFNISETSPGKYILHIKSVNTKDLFTEVFEIIGNTPIYFSPDLMPLPLERQLSDVLVQSTKPYIEQKAGKILVNLDASPTSSGLNAMDILEKSPGVSIDRDGVISLKGKTGVLIMIDGKQTYLSGV